MDRGIVCKTLAKMLSLNFWTAFFLIFANISSFVTPNKTESAKEIKDGHVMIAFLIRNKAHCLPYFFNYLQNLDYPKEKITLWIAADHNIDDSVSITKQWLERVEPLYHAVHFKVDDSALGYRDEKTACHWSPKRMENVIKLRQEILEQSRKLKINYLLITDVDNILYNSQVLKILIEQNVVAVAPLLNATSSETYANFWCGMDEKGYYKRTDEYASILQGRVRGRFLVPMIHSTVLIDLSKPESDLLSYTNPPEDYTGPVDDIIIFAISAKANNIPLYILNEDFYGLMTIPMEEYNTPDQEAEQFLHVLTHAIVEDIPLDNLPYFDVTIPKTQLMFDQIYVINLKRRPDRRRKMEACLDALGIEAKFVDAVDGRSLNYSYLDSLGFSMMPEFSDPHGQRPMTMGEIGCFLSHYFIWEEALKNNYQKIVILEDDVRFKPYFKAKLAFLFDEMNSNKVNWELLYLGRKILNAGQENFIPGSKKLVKPYYTYWTVGYMLSFQGAYKLITQKPLQKMVPVDEYLPIMFNMHPMENWAKYFSPRDLQALSVWPLYLEPTHYTGEPGYFTDTEDSTLITKAAREEPQSPARGDRGVIDRTEGHENLNRYADEL